ncbi:MAG: Na+/H+ antiporter [Proteobacteria bacterium]|nr:Na+/H+ antiporter [Pseudomonadota bacterium]MBU4298176.1 Na+/H+ antiporter [Pseudomonadota bacterium]MCG2749679.1 Na+/H+ antiporter [Desulfobulbaceae bacterium]
MHAETILILLFSVAAAVAIAVRQLQVPYTVALVLTGLGLGMLNLFTPPHLTKELLFSVFLPGLLFEAAFHIEFREFWRNRLAIASLAVPGVAAAVALTTVILTPVVNTLHLEQDFVWQYALVFGALIAATDPIAVVAIFRSLGAPRRLSVLLDGESLLNDGTAIVFFTLSLSLVTGASVTGWQLTTDFLEIVGFGGLIGAAVGLAVSQVIKQVDDAMIEITLTTIAAYGSFVTAEHFHYSGVIAVVVAGVLCGNYGARVGMTPSTRVAVETFWEYVAFALNSIVFLLIGLEVNLDALFLSWKVILVAYLVSTAGRGLVIFLVSGLLRRTREKIPWPWSVVLTWGGLRGGLPMVLVLSLAKDFPHRDLLVTMTFGVVMISILVHGMTVSPLLRWLGIVKGREHREAYEFARGKLQAANAALEELKHMSHVHFSSKDVRAHLKGEYQQRIKEEQGQIGELELDRSEIEAQEAQWARRHLLLTEKNHVIDSFQQGILDQEVYDKLLADIDTRLLRLESGEAGKTVEEQNSVRHKKT